MIGSAIWQCSGGEPTVGEGTSWQRLPPLDATIFLCRLYLFLQSEKEYTYRDLAWAQIELVKPADPPPLLLYTENVSKNNSGGLAQRKIAQKQVMHHANDMQQPLQLICGAVQTVS